MLVIFHPQFGAESMLFPAPAGGPFRREFGRPSRRRGAAAGRPSAERMLDPVWRLMQCRMVAVAASPVTAAFGFRCSDFGPKVRFR
jgi:hypothetical protein